MRESLTPKQVALAIGVSEASLKRWCDKGLLPSSRTAGGHRRLPIHGVMQFLRESGHPLVRPEILGLPPTTGSGETALHRVTQHVLAALEGGDELQLRRLLFNLYLAGHGVCDIGDRVIAQVFRDIGARWDHGEVQVYQERRACEICMRLLHELRSSLSVPEQDAPTAIGGTLSGDPYTLATTLAELALLEAGWNAASYGVNLPVDTLCVAISDKKPQLVWVSVSSIESLPGFLKSWPVLYDAATFAGAAVAVGGRALTEELRREMRYSAYCDNLNHLVSFAHTMHPQPSKDTRSA